MGKKIPYKSHSTSHKSHLFFRRTSFIHLTVLLDFTIIITNSILFLWHLHNITFFGSQVQTIVVKVRLNIAGGTGGRKTYHPNIPLTFFKCGPRPYDTP